MVDRLLTSLAHGLRELGYAEGRNIVTGKAIG